MKLAFYFLTYKFNVNIDKFTGVKVQKFWKDFLKKDARFDVEKEWTIEFHKGSPKTIIDYDNNLLCHCHESICDLTEFNNFFRETIVKLSAMDGILWLHCSSFYLNNNTYLVIGKKGFGKTTLLLNALTKCNATFISNDQLPIFVYKDNVYCLSWRPDIKVSLTNDKKSLYLVNHNLPYTFIDYDKMSVRLKKEVVAPVTELIINVKPNEIFKVDKIIILSNKQDIKSFSNSFIDYAIDDPETILPFKLDNLSKYMPYWNKRILKIRVSESANKIVDACIEKLNKQCSKYLVGNRLNFNVVKNKILEEEK